MFFPLIVICDPLREDASEGVNHGEILPCLRLFRLLKEFSGDWFLNKRQRGIRLDMNSEATVMTYLGSYNLNEVFFLKSPEPWTNHCRTKTLKNR